jgi:AraC-like DNA-binding protein
MKNTISNFNWESELEFREVDSIGDDFILLENPAITSAFNHPVKLSVVISVICINGSMDVSINLKQYRIKAPSLFVILSEQILQNWNFSEDFSGYFTIMSKRFTDDMFMNIQDRFPMKHSVYENPCTQLNSEELESITGYYNMLKNAVRMKENPHRKEIVTNLTRAFLYLTGYHNYKIHNDKLKSKNEILLEKFLGFVQANYKAHRGIEFYADKLCLTPKYLSKVIKETSGSSAGEWINNYVILDASAMLKSTGMTILQISDELNFPSQSFFGKYFKRQVGVSPKEYRKN